MEIEMPKSGTFCKIKSRRGKSGYILICDAEEDNPDFILVWNVVQERVSDIDVEFSHGGTTWYVQPWNMSLIHESLIEKVIFHLYNEFVQKCVKNHFDFLFEKETYKDESDFVKWFDFIAEFKEESLEKIEHEPLF